MVPAEVEAFCDVRPVGGVAYCQANDITLQSTVMVLGEYAGEKLPFLIDQVRGLAEPEPVEVDMRLVGIPQLISQLRVGDVDHGVYSNVMAAGATITAIQVRHTSETSEEADVKLRLKAERGLNGWVYASMPMRVGTGLTLRTPRYEIQGVITAIRPEWTPPKQ